MRYLYAAQDFADRPGDEEVFGALDRLSEAETGGRGRNIETQATTEEATESTVRPERRCGEMRDRDAFREVDRYQQIVKEYQGKTRETAERSS